MNYLFILLNIMELKQLLISGLSHRKGASNAITSTKIIESLKSKGFTVTDREIRVEVAELRKEGYLICATQKGYFLASNEIEAKEQIKKLRGRVFEMLKVVDGLETSYMKTFSQSSIL